MKSKKFLTKLIALIISLVCLVGVLSGCQLVNTDMKKDANLEVIRVQIEDEVDPISIYKKDLYSAYVSYGYYYVNNYGYSVADTYELIISNYQQNAVVEQFARIKLAELYNKITAEGYNQTLSDFETYFITATNVAINNKTLTAKSSLDDFLTPYQISEAIYNVKSNINSLIDSFVDQEEEEEEERETVSLEERANPFVEEEEEDLNEWEMLDGTTKPTQEDYLIAAKKIGDDYVIPDEVVFDNVYQLNKYVFDNYQIDISTPERAKAFNQAINSYRSLGIIDSNEFYSVVEDANNALKYDYFKKQLEDEKAQMLVLAYQSSLEKEVDAKLTAESLYADYVNLYNTQKDEYTSDYEAYETVLNELSEDTLLVYNPYDGYGFVTNLLLGFTDEQSEQLTAVKAIEGITKKEVEDFRNQLASSILVKDQRLSWATSGKIVDKNGEKVFDDKYFLSDFGKSYLNTFKGELLNLTEVKEEDSNGLEKTNYYATNGFSDSISIEQFSANYLMQAGFSNDSDSDGVIDDYAENKEEYDNIIKDLIYAFSTDPGSLSAYKGYLYSPYTSKTTYVSEFAEAAKELVEKGPGSFAMVVTDYGIHVMVCTEVIEKTDAMIGEDFINYLKGETNGLTQAQKDFIDNFKKVKQDTLVENYVSEMANSFVKAYLEEDSTATTFYKDNYKDLV